jgi:hypothetical protein
MRAIPAILLLGASLASAADPVKITELSGDSYHVQGIDTDGKRLWVTSVDKDRHKGYLLEFSLDTGKRLRTVEVTDGIRYHPGGFSADGDSLWLPVAEYRRASSAVIEKRSARTLELESQFQVADHIGCLAATPDGLVGANWDSRDFYFWDRNGRLLRKVANPTENGYQDMKFVDGRLIASGLLPGRNGAVDWLEYPSLRLIRRVPFGKTSRGVAYTNEGMTVRAGRLFLLPEGTASRLFEFVLP